MESEFVSPVLSEPSEPTNKWMIVGLVIGVILFLWKGNSIISYFTKTNPVINVTSPSVPSPSVPSPNVPSPNQSPSPIVQDDYIADESASKVGWCYIGEDRNYRSCAYTSDTCMSGNIFPTQELCINPNLRSG